MRKKSSTKLKKSEPKEKDEARKMTEYKISDDNEQTAFGSQLVELTILLRNKINEWVKSKEEYDFLSVDMDENERHAKLAKCLEVQLRALAFEVGYVKAALYVFPPESVERVVQQEMILGSYQFIKETRTSKDDIMDIPTIGKKDDLKN
jgi:hypothetical protein